MFSFQTKKSEQIESRINPNKTFGEATIETLSYKEKDERG